MGPGYHSLQDGSQLVKMYDNGGRSPSVLVVLASMPPYEQRKHAFGSTR